MAIVKVNKTNTFEQFRVKTNTVSAGVGDLSTLTHGATVSYTGLIGQHASTFTGTSATFDVSNVAGTYQIDSIASVGSGYAVNDTITILGSAIGGVDGVNDATITVTAVTPGFGVDTATIAGTANPHLVAELNLLRSESGTSTLTTTAQNFSDAINELDARQGNDALTTTATDLSAAINELDALQGNTALPTVATTITDAIVEHETDIGTVANLDTTATDLVTAINEVKATADDAQTEIGGDMVTDYDGDDTTIISALNNLFASSSVSTLNAVYLRRDGVGAMQGAIDVAQHGLKSSDNAFIIATGSSDTTRLTISTAGNVGVGKAPSSYKFDVQGSVNATTLRYNGEDTDTRYLRAGGGGGTTNITVPVDFQGNTAVTGDFTIGSELVFDADGFTFSEYSQDLVGAMFTGNSESGGISAVYNDTTGKITLAIANNSHNHTSANITDFTEATQDVVGGMVSSNTESGISVAYDDTTGKLNFNVNDPTVTLSGHVTGSATMTNLGSIDIATTLTTEAVQDAIGGMVSGNTETGISVTYDDAANEFDFALTADPTINLTGDASGSVALTNLATATFNLPVTIADNSHNHTFSNISDGTESVQDIVGDMVNPTNTEAGINVTYDDNSAKLNFDVNDYTVTLSGDVTGTVTVNNLGSYTINTTITDTAANVLKVYDVNGTQVFP